MELGKANYMKSHADSGNYKPGIATPLAIGH